MQFTDVSQKVIFSRSDIIDSFDTPAAFRYWIDKSISDNLIKRVKRDMYAVVDPTTGNIYANKYLIACASAPAAYLLSIIPRSSIMDFPTKSITRFTSPPSNVFRTLSTAT